MEATKPHAAVITPPSPASERAPAGEPVSAGTAQPPSAGPTGARKRRWWWFVAIAALVILLGVLIALVMGRRPAAGIEASGTIEATESDLAPKIQGRLLELRVHDGDRVKRGQVLAVLEGHDPLLNADQARADVVAASAQVAAAQAAYDLQLTTYATTLRQAGEGVAIAQSNVGQAGENLGIETNEAAIAVDQARAQIAAAQSAYDHATVDLGRSQRLVATGDLSQQVLDDARSAFVTGAAQLQSAKDALALAETNRRNIQVRRLGLLSSQSQRRQSVSSLDAARGERALVEQRHAQVLAAQGQLAQSRAALALALDQVHETQLAAPFDGYVISHNFEVGDLVQPGAAVITVGDLTHPYVNVYVSETDLPHVRTGLRVGVVIDGMPGRTFAGTITEVSNTAEFTPENVQTKQERIEYLVFRVKIQFTDTTGALKPGLPADAVIPV